MTYMLQSKFVSKPIKSFVLKRDDDDDNDASGRRYVRRLVHDLSVTGTSIAQFRSNLGSSIGMKREMD